MITFGSPQALEKIIKADGAPPTGEAAYSDGVDGWLFWTNDFEGAEEISLFYYHNEGIKPPRPGLTPALIDGVWYWQEVGK